MDKLKNIDKKEEVSEQSPFEYPIMLKEGRHITVSEIPVKVNLSYHSTVHYNNQLLIHYQHKSLTHFQLNKLTMNRKIPFENFQILVRKSWGRSVTTEST